MMAEKILNEDSLGKITFDDEKSLLTLEWTEATKERLGPHFQGILYILAGYALQKKSKRIFVDAGKFLFRPSDELMGPWRTKNITPLYNEAGVEKFAFLFPPGAPTPPSGQNMPNENFPTGFFTTKDELMKWIFE